MKIPLDQNASAPLYQQIEEWLRSAIARGDLARGTRLPSSRALAQDCGVSRITTDTAYRQMQADGLLETRMGSGTYVNTDLAAALSTFPGAGLEKGRPAWTVPARSERKRTAIRTSSFSFDVGIGDSRLYPVTEFRRELHRVLRADPETAFLYGDPRGDEVLRGHIAAVLSARGMRASLENVLITSGSQQGIALTAAALAKRGETAWIEAPTYRGALQCFRHLGLRLKGIPVDSEGVDVDRLEHALKRGDATRLPRFLYVIPTYQNPTGACLSRQRRGRLLELAARFGVQILEDDFVGDLRYEGPALPTLKSLDPGGLVVHVGTFSKMLMPGLRIGFLVATEEMVTKLASLKEAQDIASCSPVQRALARFLRLGRYEAHLRRSCRRYRERREALRAALNQHLSEAQLCFNPKGGFFSWVRLPRGVSADVLLPIAQRSGVSYAPGSWFFLDPKQGEPFLRLNFAARTPEETDAGIRRLGSALKLV